MKIDFTKDQLQRVRDYLHNPSFFENRASDSPIEMNPENMKKIEGKTGLSHEQLEKLAKLADAYQRRLLTIEDVQIAEAQLLHPGLVAAVKARKKVEVPTEVLKYLNRNDILFLGRNALISVAHSSRLDEADEISSMIYGIEQLIGVLRQKGFTYEEIRGICCKWVLAEGTLAHCDQKVAVSYIFGIALIPDQVKMDELLRSDVRMRDGRYFDFNSSEMKKYSSF